jgi:CDP-paratose 2-epimerase
MEPRRILINGGSGFIGSNLANHFIKTGHDVVIYDNFYRKGIRHNLDWLRQQYGDRFTFVEGDVRDYSSLLRAAEGAQVIYQISKLTWEARSTRLKPPGR